MSEIFVPLTSIDKSDLYVDHDIDGLIVGLEKYSENFNKLFNLSELEELVKKTNKKIFVAFNKLYFNEDIDKVKDVINNIKDMDITGICFSDLGVLNILNDINYKGEIVWIGNHLGTNSNTINFLEKRGVTHALLSTEITIDEIIKIKKNTNIKIGTILYGYLNMATSSRKLLTNYFEYIDQNKKEDTYIIKDKIKNKDYFLVEKDNTNFFTNDVLNGIKFYPELLENGIDFIILDNFKLDKTNFSNVIEAFSSLRSAPNDNNFINSLEKVVDSNTESNTFYGFLDKKTVYKVEDYE